MTGGSELSRKLLTVVLLSFATISGAQTATGPNKVYIEQVGSSNTITIEQVGGTNNVGGVTTTVATAVAGTGITTLTPDAPSSTNYGTITGSTNVVNITQTGNANSSQYNIRGNENSYTTNMLGNGNQTRLTIGNPNAAANNENVITEQIIGDNNMIIQDLVGSNIITNTVLDGDNNMYTKLGFKLTKTYAPDYKYYNPKVSRNKRLHKFGFGKSSLKKKYPELDFSKTERELMLELGYDRIWDCGLFKYELNC